MSDASKTTPVASVEDPSSVMTRAPGGARSSYAGLAAVQGEQSDAYGATYGVLGVSSSEESGSAGLVGESTFVNSGGSGRSGWVKGVVGRVHSPDGVAGLFENSAGGAILRGIGSDGNEPPSPAEVFRVAGNGDLTIGGEITAAGFSGDGSGLGNVDADTFDGIPAADFGDIEAVETGAGLTGGWISGDVEIAIGADALTAAQLASGAVGAGHIDAGVVDSTHVVNKTLRGVDLAPGAVTTPKLGTGAVIGGSAGSVRDGSLLAADFDTSRVQARISAACGASSAIDYTTSLGSVGCEVDDFQLPTVSRTYPASSRDGNPDYKIVSAVGRVCYLTSVILEDIDGRSENASCYVLLDQTTEPDTWVLQALSTAGDDAAAWCAMRCLEIQERVD
jgi:hypothetical protein